MPRLPIAGRRLFAGLALLTSLAVTGLTGRPLPGAEAPFFTAAEFAQRREKVYDAIGESVAVMFGAEEPDDYLRHRQDNNFYYLTGIERTRAAVLLDGRSRQATLFLPGDQAAAEAQALSAIERVEVNGAFAEAVRSACQGLSRIYLPKWSGVGHAQARDALSRSPSEPPGDRRPSRAQDFRDVVLEITGPLEVSDLEDVIDPLRRVKSPAEIGTMYEAARIGAEAMVEAIRATRPGILERELEGILEYSFLRSGSFGGAWTPIVASGPNITDFHYFANSRVIQPGDMVLIDAGPDYRYYCSDITRAWPASGPYPPRYRELYDKLLAVHKATVAAVRPGVTVRDLSRVMMDEARAQGIEAHVFRNPGHYTGMSPHDVGSNREPFVPGVCFNVEPLLLVREEGIHLRMEDTILCTEDGHEVLTPLDILPWEADALLAIRDGERGQQ